MAWTDPPRTWVLSEIPTDTTFNVHLRDQLKELWHVVNYTEFTTSVSSTTATEAAPLDIVSSGAITYAAYPTIIEFWCMEFFTSGSNGAINLWDGATDLGRMTAANGQTGKFPGLHLMRRLTPTAASHTYKFRLWTSGGLTTQATAGAGGVGTNMPGFIQVWVKGGA